MPGTNAEEWLNRNMHCSYPVADSCTPVSDSGAYLPSSFLVDIGITIRDDRRQLNTDRFYISSIVRTGSGFVVEFSYDTGQTAYRVASTGVIPDTVRAGSPLEEKTFPIVPVSFDSALSEQGLADIGGSLIIGSCEDMLGLGTLTFAPAATYILSVRVQRLNAGISSISFIDSGNSIHTASDEFILRAGDGIDFSVTEEYVDDLGKNASIITVSRVPTAEEITAPLKNVEDVLAEITRILGIPVRRINGIAPSESGDFSLAGGDCVNITQSGAGLTINNTCSKPCCGETSVSDVREAVDSIRGVCTRLTSYYESISTIVNTIQSRLSSLIASRS